MSELEQLEYFCRELYTTNDPELRSQAEKACSSLCERADCPSICQLLLQHSTSCYSQIIAATALTKYVSNRDAIISHTSRLAIRDFALNYLAAHVGLEKFVQQALITLICRLTKLGWLDSVVNGGNVGFCDILDCATKFIECGQTSKILTGVQILNNLVSEMNNDCESDVTRAIFLQRKRSASFRDVLLLPIFRLSLNLLRDADQSFNSLDLSNPEQHGLLYQSLQLVYACLSYDFIGTSSSQVNSTVCDVSSSTTSSSSLLNGLDDLVVVQIPTSWRQIFIDCETVPLFFRLYQRLSPDLCVFALSCLVQISSIRRSLFTNAERSVFLSQIVSGCRDILLSVNNNNSNTNTTTTTTPATPNLIGSPHNPISNTTTTTTTTNNHHHNSSSMNSPSCNLIHNPEAYHEFCLLLSRLKCNYQLNELVALNDYPSFIELLTMFTVNSLKEYTNETSQNSLHYLLALWQRLVASIPYVHASETHLLHNVTPQIISAYIETRLNSIPKYMNDTQLNITRESLRAEKKLKKNFSNNNDNNYYYNNNNNNSNILTKSLNQHQNDNEDDDKIDNDNINNINNNHNHFNSMITNNSKIQLLSVVNDSDNECLLDDWITLSQQLDQEGRVRNDATPQIINAYIETRLNSIPKYMNDTQLNITRESLRAEKKLKTKFSNNNDNNYYYNNNNNNNSNILTKSLNQHQNNNEDDDKIDHDNINNINNNNNHFNSMITNNSKILLLSVVNDSDNECLLDDWITLSQQLDQFGTIGRCVYDKTCNDIILLFDEYASSLEKAFNIITTNNLTMNDHHLGQILRLEEHRLAWLVYMVGALIGGRLSYANEDECDGELVCRVIQLTRLITNFITSASSITTNHTNIALITTTTTIQSPSMIRLELAVLSFFEQLRRVYVGENVGRLSKFYQCLSDKLGISDEMMMLNVFIEKILTNLKYWSNCETILQRTLNLFSELSIGFSAMRKLLRLDHVQFMLFNHTPEFFPFLLSSSTTTTTTSTTTTGVVTTQQSSSIISRLRTTFYASLTRLLMIELGENDEQFLNFIAPLTRVTNQLIIGLLLEGSSNNFNQESMKWSIIGLARDLRGISYSLNNKTSYQMLMNWIYPNALQLFHRALEIWSFDSTVTVPILKTITELLHNRNGRLLFDTTIPTGYLLFIYVSKILYNFGLQLIFNTYQHVPKNSLYEIKLKPIMATLNLLKMCLSGNLINFGVFSLFNDNSLEKSMEVGVQLLLSLNDTELHDHPKLAACHFGLLEQILNEHIVFIASLGTPILLHFLKTIANNIISLDPGISEACCICLDHFSTHLFKMIQREQRTNRTINNANNTNTTNNHISNHDHNNNNNNPNNSLYLIDINNSNNLLNKNTHDHHNTTTNNTTNNINSNNDLTDNHPMKFDLKGTANYAVWSTRSNTASTNLMNFLLLLPPPTTELNSPSSMSNSSGSGLQLLQRILLTLLCTVIQEDCRCQWHMSRPLLPLILLNQQYYTELKNRVIKELPEERQESANKLFDKLMEDVKYDLTLKNRDTFTQNLSTFKHSLGDFIKKTSSKLGDTLNQAEGNSYEPYVCLGSAIAQAGEQLLSA
ncbi:unnamed protein product [Schistosoma turkestanicum]|nr:unnamed protein product [Schistosoma turkestanicum]